MGCCACKQRDLWAELVLDTFESSIYKTENKHPFACISSSSLSKEILANSISGKIHSRNLERICNHLGLDFSVLQENGEFLDSLKTDRDNFSTEQLVFASILLGKDYFDTKLRILFEYIDRKATGEVQTSNLIYLINDIFEMASICVPLVSESTEDFNLSSNSSKRQVLKRVSELLQEKPSYNFLELLTLFNSNLDLQMLLHAKGIEKIIEKERFKNSEERGNTYENSRDMTPEKLTNPSVKRIKSITVSDSFFSNDSSEPIMIQVQLTDRLENFVFFPDEDPYEAAKDFSNKHGLSQKERDRLMKSIEYICTQIGA